MLGRCADIGQHCILIPNSKTPVFHQYPALDHDMFYRFAVAALDQGIYGIEERSDTQPPKIAHDNIRLRARG